MIVYVCFCSAFSLFIPVFFFFFCLFSFWGGFVGCRVYIAIMEEGIANPRIDGEEACRILLEAKAKGICYEYCLVGSFLIASAIQFQAMRISLANIWHLWRFYFRFGVIKFQHNLMKLETSSGRW